MLTPLRYEATRLHMVTITSADDMGVRVNDPVDGPLNMNWDTVEQVFSGQVLVFIRR